MRLKDLGKVTSFEKVIIHSLAPNLYQLSVVVDGEELFVENDKGALLSSHNKQDLQTLFKDKEVASMVLHQQSAYDEMVGQPTRESANRLEVPIGNTDLF
ncbi:DUF6482 family protein [Marinomonas sp. C2222]|uniref:DUF6482 family protein n=1 Tax=Marinomonas sargassi TaxID=2984494 RepID=A0ABT2YV57_9GAMM|nr:DUF6482 family protein [Marinomonas sargassi]MCV2403787.1 DUF6482 family protein [Marinomonas sargassi]